MGDPPLSLHWNQFLRGFVRHAEDPPTLPHGHVEAILEMFARLELGRLIAVQRCRERDLVVAMIVQSWAVLASYSATV